MAKTDQSVIVLPKTAAACADLLYKTREKRLALQREAADCETLEKALKDYFINNLPKEQTGVAGKIARVQTGTKAVPTVQDWDKLYMYIGKKKAFYLLQRRLSESAVKDMWDANKEIPGVGTFNVVTVSCTALG